MNNKKRLLGFFAVVAVPILILLLMTVKPLLALGTGQEIALKTKPIDPRDLLYGDYVYLSYEIEDVSEDKLDRELIKKAKSNNYGSIKMYAILKKQGDVYTLDHITAKKPDKGVYLIGDLYAYQDYTDSKTKSYKYDANYNLDRYYVPENTGKSLEDKAQKGKLTAYVKVRNGYGILTTIK
ncbi:GDYXXLXY domain-containing protein [Aciduricibacillus chroicocephali]|uniref:GDYXXLXY domain-containing protein n=1 Tax=Aciduricibacillus chroicocephali TaxID=3054939 RepID=A0ABY9KV74_9BACI|nr:GDYXXLXY domain-containing protein [Bacillaceae bacterium 44XB]